MLPKHLLAPLLAATLLVLSAASALASDTATDLFDGTATTGAGSSQPIDVDPTRVTVRSDGAVGIGYTYKAEGRATGDLPGRFQYREDGYLFFRNPADPTTFVGARYDGSAFTLQPSYERQRGTTGISIADTNPAAYQAGQRTAPVPQLDKLLRTYGDRVLKQLGLVPVGGVVHYGFFTFTDAYGTFTGISTPDSRHFLLRLKFAPSYGKHEDQPATAASDLSQSSRFTHP